MKWHFSGGSKSSKGMSKVLFSGFATISNVLVAFSKQDNRRQLNKMKNEK
jgi:hypothetical protein